MGEDMPGGGEGEEFPGGKANRLQVVPDFRFGPCPVEVRELSQHAEQAGLRPFVEEDFSLPDND